jgi:hypothetical protein
VPGSPILTVGSGVGAAGRFYAGFSIVPTAEGGAGIGCDFGAGGVSGDSTLGGLAFASTADDTLVGTVGAIVGGSGLDIASVRRDISIVA